MSNFKKELAEYTKNLNKASQDENLAQAVTRAIKSYRQNVEAAMSQYPHTSALAEEARAIKDYSMANNKELLEQAMQVIESNHGQAFYAEDREAAINIVKKIVGKEKIIVKGKSMLAEELDLREALQEEGNEVWETDLGEFILQLKNDRPMHILAPSIHVPREQVAEIFSKFFQKEISADIAELVSEVREFLREKYFTADVGISGANVVAADTGQIVIIENEGNVRLCTGLPPVHIVIVGLEKLVPTFQEAMKVAEVTWRYANYGAPGYVNIISGPSRTGDIEKVITYGAHGPKEFYVIFVNNGRRAMMNDENYRQALHCLRCGGCMYECPVFQVTAGHYGRTYLSGIGSVWTSFVEGVESAAPMLYTCLRCGRCVERCPMQIDVPKMVGRLRSELASD
ncbi:MAG: lactate utilization protein [Peptococcaceae bacterium]|nr:lactate utilization protein [Peptococcaceae bacterium]